MFVSKICPGNVHQEFTRLSFPFFSQVFLLKYSKDWNFSRVSFKNLTMDCFQICFIDSFQNISWNSFRKPSMDCFRYYSVNYFMKSFKDFFRKFPSDSLWYLFKNLFRYFPQDCFRKCSMNSSIELLENPKVIFFLFFGYSLDSLVGPRLRPD